MSSSSSCRQRKGASASAAPSSKATPAASSRKQTVIDTTDGGHLGVTLGGGGGTGVGGVGIMEIHHADLIAKAGLKVGDIIVAVAGTEVNDHEKALAAFDSGMGGKITVEYFTAAEAKEITAAVWSGRRRKVFGFFAFLVKLLLLLSVIATILVAVGYHVLDQDIVKDRVDMQVLPKLGFDRPSVDMVTGKPLRVVVHSKDPAKPWMVPGWNRNKEINAIERIKKLTVYEFGKANWEKEFGDAMKSPRMVEMLEQTRMTGGKHLEAHEKMNEQFAQMKDMYSKNGAGMPGMGM